MLIRIAKITSKILFDALSWLVSCSVASVSIVLDLIQGEFLRVECAIRNRSAGVASRNYGIVGCRPVPVYATLLSSATPDDRCLGAKLLHQCEKGRHTQRSGTARLADAAE